MILFKNLYKKNFLREKYVAIELNLKLLYGDNLCFYVNNTSKGRVFIITKILNYRYWIFRFYYRSLKFLQNRNESINLFTLFIVFITVYIFVLFMCSVI